MPVGTKGAMKGLLSCDLARMNCKLMLSNTYHLAFEPGDEFLKQNYENNNNKNAIHNYMKWNNNVLTDSGGFQIASLTHISVRSEEGVEFISHAENDNRRILLTPEKSISIQNNIGSDIIMCLDDVISPLASKNEIYDACERSIRWLDRCIKSHKRKDVQNLFGIVQGGIDLNLREIACTEMEKRNLPGYAIGGMAGGESKEDFWKVVDTCTNYLPSNKPRYLMGIGYPIDLVVCSLLGVDMFDCVFATRTARFGTAFTNNGFIKLKNQKFKFDFNPIEIECDCEVCQKYTKSYFYYMFNKNPRAVVLISFHNVYYLLNLMKKVRNSIIQGNVNDFVKDFFMKQFPDSTPSWIRDALKKAGVNIDFIEKVDDRIFYGDNITDEEDE
jgi:queuine tRNA-ribosyltransferase